MSNLRPTVRSVVMCDCVFQDKATNKWYMLGAFENISGRLLPVTYAPIALYIAMGDWTEEGAFSIKVVCESTELVAQMPAIKIPANPDPGGSVRIGVNLPPLTLKRVGRYAIEIFANDNVVHEFVFHVRLRTQNRPEDK